MTAACMETVYPYRDPLPLGRQLRGLSSELLSSCILHMSYSLNSLKGVM